ncbi:MAG: hypothetical protein HRT53_01455 [Colwellia sp.]|nr:hypothetical protein [Colwellia sp.]
MLLTYSLRKLRQKPQQFIILVLCFSFFLTFITLCLAIGDYVLRDRPVWAEQNVRLITLGKTTAEGGFSPVSQQDVELLAQVSGVKQVESMSLMPTTLQTEQSDNKNKVQAALFSHGMGALLAQDITAKISEAGEKRLVWLSHEFWEQQFKRQNIRGQNIYLGSERTAFTVAGILPESMNYIGSSSVDIWLSAEFITKLLPINIQFPENMDFDTKEQLLRQAKQTILKKMEIRYGIAIIAADIPLPRIMSDYQALDKPADNAVDFTMLGAGLDYWLVPGMQFAPQVKQKLQSQWWLLTTLVMFFGALAIINLASFASNQLIERRQEIIVRLTSGAQTYQLLQQFLIESVPLLLVVMGLTTGLISTLYVFFADHAALISFLGGPLPSPSGPVLILSMLIILISILAANIIPMYHGLKDNLFSRQTGGGEDLQQQRSRVIINFVQLIIAGITVFLSCYFISAQWQQKTLDGFAHHLVEYNVRQVSGHTLSNTLVITLQQQLGQEVAFTGSRFVDPDAARDLVHWAGQDINSSVRILRMSVSANYFKLLQPNFLAAGELNQQNVIINQAALKLLSGNKSAQSVLDQSLIIGETNSSTKQVAAVVANLPHYGQQNSDTPVIYTLYNNDLLLNGYLLLNNIEALKTIALPDIELKERGSLQTQVAQLDLQRIWFILMSLTLLAILMLSAIFTLYYQIQATLKKQYLKLGTLLAVGAPDHKILHQSLVQFSPPYFAALTSLVLFWLLSLSQEWFHLTWHTVSYLIISIITLTVIMGFLILLAFREVISVPISDLVRYQD